MTILRTPQCSPFACPQNERGDLREPAPATSAIYARPEEELFPFRRIARSQLPLVMRSQKIKAITQPLVLKKHTHDFQLRQSVADIHQKTTISSALESVRCVSAPSA